MTRLSTNRFTADTTPGRPTALRTSAKDCGQRADDGALHLAEVVVIEVGAFGHGKEGFALQFEPRWQGGFHHFSGMAEVVVGHPAPEVNLVFEQEWLGVHEFFDVFELVGRQRGRVLVEAEDDAGVAFGLSERNDHARAHLHAPFEERRDAVGVGTGDGEGEDDVGKHVGWGFWRRNGGKMISYLGENDIILFWAFRQ